jgi:hypothetical protein
LLQFLTIFLLAAAPARADFACHDFAHLPFQAEDCDDNEKVGQDALECVRSYHAHVQKAQADVLAKFQAQIAQLKNQQSDSFDRTQAGYEDARKKLDALISDGHVAHAAVDDLLDNLAFPEDYDHPEITGKKTEAYLATSKCYSIPRRVLQQSQVMIDKMLDDLAATKVSVQSMGNGSGTRSANVQVLESNRAIANTHGAGSGKVGSGRSGGSASDITGVKPKGAGDLPK